MLIFSALCSRRSTWNANSGGYSITSRGSVKSFTGSASKSFFDSTIVAVYAWGVIHDRPVTWACDPKNWPEDLLNLLERLPSQSTMSRRLQTTEVQCLFAAIEKRLSSMQSKGWIWRIDGKPLPIGGFGKDPDAKRGYATGGKAKGYKLHALYGDGPLPSWDVAPMNVAESDEAVLLIANNGYEGYVLGDKSYDSNRLHRAATACGCQLVAERKKPQAGLGHGPQSPGRLHSIDLLRKDFGRELYECRDQIERAFGWLTNHSGGLAPLPAWVRRIHRVRLWVQTKLICHFLYTKLKPPHPALAVA